MHVIVSGWVQGVGFRATTRFLARQANVTGSVKNLPDGTVEIYAQGTQDQLDKFIELIQNKFGSKHIEAIQLEFFDVSEIKKSFDIE
jgi:acylphosphatase